MVESGTRAVVRNLPGSRPARQKHVQRGPCPSLYLYLFLKHGSNPSYVLPLVRLPLVRPSRGSDFSSSVPVGTDRIPRAIRQIEPDSNTAHVDIKQVHASLPSLNESPSLPIVIAAIINRCPLL